VTVHCSSTGGDNTDDDAAERKATAEGRARPRYITGLLRTAQHWNREHNVVHKRRVIREQDADKNPEYKRKETFVMSSYRRKIEEQECWAAEEGEGEQTRRKRRLTQNQGNGGEGWPWGASGLGLLGGTC
jgi:hypothetical protein